MITGEEAAEQDADDVQEGFAFFQHAHHLRRHRPARRHLRDLQHLLDPGGPAHPRAGPAPGGRRRAGPRCSVGDARGGRRGLIAAVLGLLAGIRLAAGITAALGAVGADLPTAAGHRPNTVVIGLVIGLVVTVIAAVIPAIRATRVPPWPPSATSPSTAPARRASAAVGGLVVLVLAAVLTCRRPGRGDGDTDAIPTVGLGALLLIVGAIVIGPVLASRTIRPIGSPWPASRASPAGWPPENAARSAQAHVRDGVGLIIGVALIGFITVFAESAKASVEAEVTRGLRGRHHRAGRGRRVRLLRLQPGHPEAVARVDGRRPGGGLPAARPSSPIPTGETTRHFVGAVDPEVFIEMATPKMEEGELDRPTDGGIVVDRQVAEDNDLSIGDTVLGHGPGGGALDLEVQGISDDLVVLGFWTIDPGLRPGGGRPAPRLPGARHRRRGADLDAVLADVETPSTRPASRCSTGRASSATCPRSSRRSST